MFGKKLVVVIDGPAGAGKSTVSRRLSKKINYIYLDSGALYRCVALQADRRNIAPQNTQKLFQLAKRCNISFKKGRGQQRVFLNRKDVTKSIRTPKISMLASQYAGLKVVRKALLFQQRKLGKKGGIVGEGRDLGTVVFPKAEVKFFLVASLKERAKRRFKELKLKGVKNFSKKAIQANIRRRDQADAKRALAPLKKAKDAIRVDTTVLSIDEVILALYKHVRERMK